MMQVILASQSPRRRELLNRMGVEFTVVPSNYEERLDDGRTPEEVAMELGLGKALEVAARFPDAIVIGSDTIVSLGGKQLGKPDHRTHAREMLEYLAGKENAVTSSVAVVCKAKNVQIVEVETSKLLLKPFDAQKVEAYLDTGDFADKAGGYGVQSGFAHLVEYIDGYYDTVIGLPTRRLAVILQELGIQARPAQLPSPLPSK